MNLGNRSHEFSIDSTLSLSMDVYIVFHSIAQGVKSSIEGVEGQKSHVDNTIYLYYTTMCHRAGQRSRHIVRGYREMSGLCMAWNVKISPQKEGLKWKLILY